MAHSEACQLYIEEQVKEKLAEGKTPTEVAKEVFNQIKGLFEVTIPVETLRSRARHIRRKSGEITGTPPTLSNNSENQVKPVEHGNITPQNTIEFPEKRVNQPLRDEKGKFVKVSGPGRPGKYQEPPSSGPGGNPKDKPSDVLLNRHSDAMYFATIAISQLERIMPDDPDRVEALQKVKDWIDENM